MAKSPTYNTSNDRVKYYITATTNSQSIANNTSSITVKVYFYRTNTGYTTYGSGTVYCKINGTEYTQAVTSSQKITDKPIALFNKTITIRHNNDGSKTVPLQAKISLNTPLTSNYSTTYNYALKTIPRASIIGAVASFTTGSSVTIPITKYSSAFTDTLTVKIGSTVIKTVTPITTGTSVSFTSAELDKIYNALPNASKGTVTWHLTTKNGTAIVGTSQDTSTVTINANIKPSISSITLTEAVTNIATQFGAYLQNKSKISGTINAVAGAGSKIDTYTININGATYTTRTFTTDFLKTLGAGSTTNLVNRCRVTVRDTRGRTAELYKDFTVLSYTSPKIVTFNVLRVNQDGTENDEALQSKYIVEALIDNVNNKNTKAFKLEYKKKTDATFTLIKDYNTSYIFKEEAIQSNIDNNVEYDYKLTVKDFFNTVTKTFTLSTAPTILDIKEDGTAIAFGKVATESNTFDVGFSKTHLSDNVTIGGSKRNDNEKNIYFDTTDQATHPSSCKIYGGNGASDTSIGMWDSGNSRQIFRYLASNGLFQFGSALDIKKGDKALINEVISQASTNHGQVQLSNGLLLQWGKVSVTPSAPNVATAVTVTYPIPYKKIPIMLVAPQTSAPQIAQCSVGQSTSSGLRNFAIYVTRSNTTATSVMWLAVGLG